MFKPRATHRSTGRALLALVTLVASLVLTSVPADAVTVSSGVIGGFQQDGNEILDAGSGITGTIDWDTLVAAPVGTLSVITDDTADSGFTGGSKELSPSGWVCGNGGADPGKANILKAFVNPRISGAGVFLDLAFIRELGDEEGGNGDVHLNFEFNQANVSPPGTFVAGACPITRAAGDLLVTYDFPGGAGAPTINVYRWDATNPPGPDEGSWVGESLDADEVAGAVNPGIITDPVGGYGTLAKQRFGEASLDLTDILAPDEGEPQCVSFGSANIRSRSSGESETSALQDKLPGTPIDFSTCGRIDLVKKSDTGELLAGAKFQLYQSADDVLDAGEKVGPECTTIATGVCSWEDLTPGTYFVVETAPPAGYSLDDDPVVGPIDVGFRESVTLDGTSDVDGDDIFDGFVNYKWRYSLNLSPDASNLVGTDHVFTATLQVQKAAGGAYVAAGSETLDIALTGLVGSIVSPGPTCVTDINGQCAITIRSNSAGDSTLSVSFDDKVTTLAVDAGDSAVKHWINYRIDIAPDATNVVGTAHTFTVTLGRDAGSGFLPLAGAHPDVTKVSGPGDFSDDTCATAGTDDIGQCTITLTSGVTGTTVVKALYEATEETTSNTFSDIATKNWVDYDLTVAPDGVNHAGDDHVFTVLLVQLVNDQPVGVAGETVALDWDGTGTILPAASCVTDADGECSVTASSDETGSGTLTARWGILLDSGQLNRVGSADKTWIDWDISITPNDKTNLVGTDHVFTVKVRYDAGDGDGLQPLAGATPAIDLQGVGTIDDSTCDEGTTGDGTCTVTITSDETGLATVTASWHAFDTASEVFEDLTASAVKHWVSYGLTVEPDGVNHAGDPHAFTVWLFEIVNGEEVGLDGETVSLDWDGSTGSIASESCETVDGECSVVASSDVTGTGTITASWSKQIDSGLVELEDSADKTWIDWDISITPDDKTNLVGTDHVFTVTVRYDAGDGDGLQPLAGAHPDIDIDGVGTIEQAATTCDEGTTGVGTCTVTITSADPGNSTVTASWHATHATSEVFEDLSASAVKHWVDYQVLVEPDAVNRVGDDHVFTVTVSRDNGSESGFAPLAGVDVQLAWSGGAGSGITAVSPAGATPLTSCTTDDDGRCMVTVSSSTPLSGNLTATYLTQLDSGTHSFSSDANKRWVNWGLSITPAQAENLVGTSHTFVVKVTHDAGTGGGMLPLAGAKPVISLAGLGSVTLNTCSVGTDANGICTVTITSAQPGTSTVSASFQAVLDQASISLQAEGRKLWVDYRLVVSPKTAVNPVGTTHTFTVTLEKNTGSGFVPAPSETVNLGLAGPGSIIIVDAGTIGSGVAATCTTDAAGSCRVTITSPLAGLATLQAGYNGKVGETSRTFTDSGNKLWEVVPVVAQVEALVASEPPVPVLVAAEELPRTGAGIAGQAWLAISLLSSGLLLHLVGRRRRSYPPSV